MFPIGDAIPTRRRPSLTTAVAVAAVALLVPPALRPWSVAWLADGLAIWVFGRTLEDRMGHARFALFTGLGSAAATAAAALVGPVPDMLAIAGGAAAALSAGYLSRYRQAPVLTLVPVPFGVEIIELPAWFIAAIWGVVHAAVALGAATNAGSLALVTGWLAAAGLGLLLARPFSRRERESPDWWGA